MLLSQSVPCNSASLEWLCGQVALLWAMEVQAMKLVDLLLRQFPVGPPSADAVVEVVMWWISQGPELVLTFERADDQAQMDWKGQQPHSGHFYLVGT